MSWVLHKAAPAFESHRALWDELNRKSGDNLLLDSRFVAPLVRYFGTAETFLGVNEDRARPGLALVERRRPGFWQTFQPPQAPLGLIVLAEPRSAVEQVRSLLRSLPGFALEFAVLQQDPCTSAFQIVSESTTVSAQKYIDTARITVRGSFHDYWSARGRDLVDNLARRIRRLERDGTRWEIRCEQDSSRVAGAIADYARLEGSGWKAKEGTAVTADNDQGKFYRDVLEAYCQQGEGVIYQLLLDGRTVASQLGLKRNGTLVLLKMAFDEEFRSHAPGYLLQYKILEAVFDERDMRFVEFFGRMRKGWTDKWTEEVRSMFHATFYRHGWVRWALNWMKKVAASRRHVTLPDDGQEGGSGVHHSLLDVVRPRIALR